MYNAEQINLPVEWDVLASISARCLRGRIAGFIQVEIIPQPLPAIVTFRLFHPRLGEFGTVEISKSREGISQIFFTGLPIALPIPAEMRTEKEQHYQAIKDAYFFMLSQDGILEDEDTEPPLDEEEQPKPWDCIPDDFPDCDLARFIVAAREREKLTASQISKRILETFGFKKSEAQIYNIFTELRHLGLNLPDRQKNPVRSELDH